MSETGFDTDTESETSESETSESETSGYVLRSESNHESLADIEAEAKILLSESKTSEYVSNLSKPRLSEKKVKVAWFIGARGAGKTTAMEEDVEALYNEYLTSLYLWASRSNENVFVGVNLNCKQKWRDFFDKIVKK